MRFIVLNNESFTELSEKVVIPYEEYPQFKEVQKGLLYALINITNELLQDEKIEKTEYDLFILCQILKKIAKPNEAKDVERRNCFNRIDIDLVIKMLKEISENKAAKLNIKFEQYWGSIEEAAKVLEKSVVKNCFNENERLNYLLVCECGIHHEKAEFLIYGTKHNPLTYDYGFTVSDIFAIKEITGMYPEELLTGVKK